MGEAGEDDKAVGREVLRSEGRIERCAPKRIPTLEELMAQITPENRHGEADWGTDVGNEIVEW